MRLGRGPRWAQARPLFFGTIFSAPLLGLGFFFGDLLSLLAGLAGLVFFHWDTKEQLRLYHVHKDSPYPSVISMMTLKKSFCSRGVAISLFGDDARSFYHDYGYRWWHVFPNQGPKS